MKAILEPVAVGYFVRRVPKRRRAFTGSHRKEMT